MIVQAGMGFYHVGAANTNRIARFTVECGVANWGGTAGVFLRGVQPFYPFSGQLDTWNGSASAVNDKIANYRVDYLIRQLTQYAIPVEISLGAGTGALSKLTIGFETFESNVFPNVNDIVDTLGKADRAAKTKPGLQTLASAILGGGSTPASLDGGATNLFDINPHLADGTASTAGAITALTVAAIGTVLVF